MTLRTLILAGCALALTGCQTFSLEDYAAAANELDPDCYKNVHIDVKPLLLPGWIVPVVSGSYDKVCNADKAKAGP